MDQTPKNENHLEQALLAAVGLFEALHIPYALIGGLAAMVYGKSRFTEDVDFVAQPGHMQTLQSNTGVMQQFGFDPKCTWKLYHQSGIDIDIWKDEHASTIIEHAQPIRLAGTTVAVARAEDLVAMKLRSDRPQDEYDISEILKAGMLDQRQLQAIITDEQAQRLEQIKKRIGLAE